MKTKLVSAPALIATWMIVLALATMAVGQSRKIAELQIADVTTKQYLFTSYRTKGMIAEIKTAFTGAVRDAGLEDFRFHDLRHIRNPAQRERRRSLYDS